MDPTTGNRSLLTAHGFPDCSPTSHLRPVYLSTAKDGTKVRQCLRHPPVQCPRCTMLWAQFQPKNDAEMVAFAFGAIFAGVVCGAIPLSTGIAMKQPILGVIAGIISAATGALIGCCLGLPFALLLSGVIAVVG